MSEGFSEQEIALRQQAECSEGVLQGYERELQAIDGELGELAEKNHQYELLTQVCQSLEELDALDAAHLFWSRSDNSVDSLGRARQKIDEYGAEIAAIQNRRQSIIGKIGKQNDDMDDLHYQQQVAAAQEQRRQNNWIIEREIGDMPKRDQVMPWTRGFEEDKRFRQSMAGSILAATALAVLVGTIALPVIEHAATAKLPERVAKVVRERRIPPPVAEPVAEPNLPQEELPKPKPKPELVQEPAPTPIEKPVVAEVQQPDSKEKVKSKGILAFRDSFASRASIRPVAQLGSRAKFSSAGESAVGLPQRSMVTKSAPGSSGGINLAEISRDVGGGGGGQGLAGVQVTQVASTIGGSGGADRPLSGGVSAGRTDEEIQIVFDRYKAALYRLYNRELRKDPTLRGQIVLRLTIEPDGSVSLCELQGSDMQAPTLAQQIVSRVLTFDFGAKNDIVAMTIIYPIDFLPAA